jgi:hypothetical protein
LIPLNTPRIIEIAAKREDASAKDSLEKSQSLKK